MSSVRGRIITFTMLVMILGGVLSIVAFDRSYRTNITNINERMVSAADDQFTALQESEIEKLYMVVDTLSVIGEINEAFRSGDRERLMELSGPLYEHLNERHGIDRWYYYTEEPDGTATVLLRVYEGDSALVPEMYGDVVDSPIIDSVRETGSKDAGFILGRSRLSLRAVAPLTDDTGRIIGYISLGKGVSDLLGSIAGETGDGYAMFLDKRLLDRDAWVEHGESIGPESEWDDRVNTVLVATTFEDPRLIEALDLDEIPSASHAFGASSREGRSYTEGSFPLRDVSGKPVGAVLVLHDISAIASSMRETQMILVIFGLAVALAGASAVALFLDRLVFRRLESAILHAEEYSIASMAGDSIPPLDTGRFEDEIARFERFLYEYARAVAEAFRGSRHR